MGGHLPPPLKDSPVAFFLALNFPDSSGWEFFSFMFFSPYFGFHLFRHLRGIAFVSPPLGLGNLTTKNYPFLVYLPIGFLLFFSSRTRPNFLLSLFLALSFGFFFWFHGCFVFSLNAGPGSPFIGRVKPFFFF